MAVTTTVGSAVRALLNPTLFGQFSLLLTAFGAVLTAQLRVAQKTPQGGKTGTGVVPYPTVDSME